MIQKETDLSSESDTDSEDKSGDSGVRSTAKAQPRGRLGLSHGETGKKQVVKSLGNNRICNRQASWDFLREKQVGKPSCQITWD